MSHHPHALRRALTGAIAATLLVGSAACTGSSGPPSSGSGVPAGLDAGRARAALLSEAEVAPLRTQPDPGTKYPPPCTPDAKPLDRTVRPAVHVERTFGDETDSIQVTEQINNYGDDATVARAVAAIARGYSCHDGFLSRFPVQIAGPIDLAKRIASPVDSVQAWSVSSTVAKQSVIVAHLGTQLVLVTFGARTGSNVSTLDAAGITQKAIAKVRAAG